MGFRLEECVENGKPTWVDLGRGGQSGLRMVQENRALIERLSNRIGYHFHLQHATYPRRAARNGFNLELTWTNQGVAPIYIPCDVAVALFDESGQRVASAWPEEFRPPAWMPAQLAVEKARVNFPEIAAGEYRLGLAITRKKNDARPYVRIGTDLPAVHGWLVLGKIRIAP
jgi:hypothetical protein